jgi:hypothetical protein
MKRKQFLEGGLTLELTPASGQQAAPAMQSIAGAAPNKSGRLDLNRRPPAPEAGQYTNQLQHSAGLSRETGRRCRSFPTFMSYSAGRNSPRNSPQDCLWILGVGVSELGVQSASDGRESSSAYEGPKDPHP